MGVARQQVAINPWEGLGEPSDERSPGLPAQALVEDELRQGA